MARDPDPASSQQSSKAKNLEWPSPRAERTASFGHMERQPPDAPERAMTSERQAFAGSAEGVGSVDYDDPGAFDVTLAGAAARPQEQASAPRADADAGAPAPNVTGTRAKVEKPD